MRRGIRLLAGLKRPLTVAGVGLTALVAPVAAEAYFLSGGSGSGSASVGVVNVPTSVVAKAANASTSLGASPVTITWTAPASGATPTGYQVERGTTLLSCTSSPCTDSNVPDGTYTYHVVSVYRSWTSSATDSNSLTIQNDSTPPTTHLALVAPSRAFLVGAGPYTLFFKGDTSGSFRLADAVTDSGAGPASANFPAVSPAGWSGHTVAELVTSGTGSAPTITYTSSASSAYQWSAGAATPADATVTAKDGAGNATADTVHFASDTTAPTGGSVTVNGLVGTGGLYSNSKTVSLTLAKGSDGAGSGIAASGNVLQREEGTLSSSNGIANGVCDYTGKSFSTIATDPSTGTYSDAVPNANVCYRYQYLVTDNVGNVATYSSGDVKVETAAPASLTPSNATVTAATGSSYQFETTVSGVPTVYYNPAQTGSFTVSSSASDATSGVVKTTFPTMTGFSGGGGDQTSPSSGTTYSTTYSWSNNGSSNSPGTQSISATDNATLAASNASAFSIVKDNTAPSGSIASSGTSGSIGLTATSVADTGSGTASVAYYRCTGTGSACTGTTPLNTAANWTLIGTSTTASGSWPASWDSTTVANGSYTLQAVLADNVSNQAATGNQVTVAVNNSYSFSVSNPAATSAVTAGSADNNAITVRLLANGSATNHLNGISYGSGGGTSHTLSFSGTAFATAPDGSHSGAPTSSSLSFDASGQATIAAGTFTFYAATTGAVLTATDSTNSITGSSTSFTVAAAAPATVTKTAGDNQSVLVGSAFATTLQVTVKDSFGNTEPAGVPVTFAAPTSGASGTFAATGCSGQPPASSCTLNTGSGGVATATTFTANTTAGSYNVTATAAGGANPTATFALTNNYGPWQWVANGAAQSWTSSSGGTNTVNYPTGAASGDLLILTEVQDGNVTGGSPATPTGWNLLGDMKQGSSTRVTVFWRTAGSETSASVVSTQPGSAWIVAYSRPSGAGPAPTLAGTATVLGSTKGGASFTGPAITTTGANATVISVVGIDTNNAVALSTANSFSLQAGLSTASPTTGFGLADRLVPTAGSVTAPSWTGGASGTDWVGVTAAFN